MKIILEASDITAAMIAHVGNMGFDLSDKEVETAFNAGRGANTHTVTLEINPTPSVTSPKAVTNVTVAEVEKAVEASEPVEEEAEKEEEEATDNRLFGNNS